MVYDLILPLAGAFIIIFLILILRRSGKSAQDKNAARRRPTRSGLVLERSPKEKKSSKSSLTGPVIIALVLIIIGAWLAASYLTPGEPADLADLMPGGQIGQPPQEPEDSRIMSGKITLGEDSSAGADTAPMAEAAVQAGAAGLAAAGQAEGSTQAAPPLDAPSTPPLPPASATTPAVADPLASAAKSMLPAISRMEQVGLMPAKGTGGGKSANADKTPPSSTPKTPPAASAKQTGGGTKAAAAESPAPSPEVRPPASGGTEAGGDSILAGTREFTVHLGSFADRNNADRYQSTLTAAGVTAFVTESTVNGKLWYRVMSGRFKSQAEAEAHGSDLKRRGLTTSSGRYVIKSI
ncbi:hypothetical protein C4J81_04620 [Deltaproteobacteria bacterium Smac51]|nr:hypothetical protein C4J81_04620 [Deltaproteobacteria bacterium Smac51]